MAGQMRSWPIRLCVNLVSANRPGMCRERGNFVPDVDEVNCEWISNEYESQPGVKAHSPLSFLLPLACGIIVIHNMPGFRKCQ
jgi:hypothetical protein